MKQQPRLIDEQPNLVEVSREQFSNHFEALDPIQIKPRTSYADNGQAFDFYIGNKLVSRAIVYASGDVSYHIQAK